MTITRSSRRRTAGSISLLSALLLVCNALFLSPSAVASDKNPTCADYGLVELTKFDPVEAETGDVLQQDGVTVTITSDKGNNEALTFDWTSTEWVSAVIVKASDEANVYQYDPSVKSGSAVTVENHGISHITFCLGTEPPDEEVEPAAPTFTEPDCDNDNTPAVVADDTDAVDYTISGDVIPGGTVTVDAVAKDSYALTGTTHWEHTFDEAETPCEQTTEVTPDEPTFTDPTCDTDADLTLPDGPDGVTYVVDGTVGPGNTVTVTAVADEDHVLPDDATTSWEHTYADAPTDCDEVEVSPDVQVRPAVSFLDPTCTVPDRAQVVLTEVDGITYGVVGDEAPGGTVTVTATADDGYAIPDGIQVEWTHTFTEATDCVEVLPETIEKPTPAPQPAAEELAATGLDSVELLLLAVLLLGLGAGALLAPEARRER